MAIAKSCPGSRTIREPIPEYLTCSGCGAEVEIWSDELSAACLKCGTRAFKEQRPSCIDWCPHAAECVGVEALQRMRPAIGKQTAEGKETTALDMMEREHEHALNQIGLLRGATLCLRVSGRSGSSSPVIDKALEDLNRVFDFVDTEVRTHFRHEEEVLFPAMAAHLPRENSPMQALLSEHVEFWQLFDSLRNVSSDLATAKAERVPPLCNAAYDLGGRLAGMLQEHIRKENESLLPLARHLLSEAEVASVSSQWK